MADGLIAADQIGDPPLFRHAQHLKVLSSPADEIDPVVTDHGDFLYFASGRDGGHGGTDIYRSRFERKLVDDDVERFVATEPKNLGPEINSSADESAPAPRMAGFHLMFNTNRGENPAALFGAKSKRVERRYDYSKMPTGAWMADHINWLLGLGLALLVMVFGTWNALRRPAPRSTETAGAGT